MERELEEDDDLKSWPPCSRIDDHDEDDDDENDDMPVGLGNVCAMLMMMMMVVVGIVMNNFDDDGPAGGPLHAWQRVRGADAVQQVHCQL